MNITYKSTHDLYNEILEVKLIDLLPHVLGIDQNLLEVLEDPAPGLYLPSSIEPYFVPNGLYVLMTRPPSATYLPITLDDILRDALGEKSLPPGDLYIDSHTVSLIRRSSYERIKKYLTKLPSLPVRGCEVAIATVLSYLQTLCQYTHIHIGRYHLGSLVKQEFHYLLYKEVYESAFNDLYVDVKNWVGRDIWNYYYYKVAGTTLVLRKGLDYRIVEWHRKRIEESEGYDHDLGGIQDGYEGSSRTKK
ncbi:MAG TPA: hypothetical protein VN843_17555 [Anaerolineales bacterium]|nr:hypothetical protein [Anaerolineales bacterium]